LAYRVVRSDGTIRHVNNIAHPVFDAAGDLTEYVGTTIDTTERIRSERALRESEELLGVVFERSATGTALTDLQGRFVKANHAFQELLGYTEAELLRTTFQDITYPGDIERNLALTVELLNGTRDEYQLDFMRNNFLAHSFRSRRLR
jgi:PAS domain-containing protein